MPAKRSDQDRIGRLLLKAVRGLPQREQDEVLACLLGRSTQPGLWGVPPSLMAPPLEAGQAPPTQQMDQPLLVRLPAELHGRLRSWSTTHGFSMAAVSRGLIERFLEEQRSA